MDGMGSWSMFHSPLGAVAAIIGGFGRPFGAFLGGLMPGVIQAVAILAQHRVMPGHEPRPHSHVHQQIVLILAGTTRSHVDGEQHPVGPNGLLAIPPKVEHWKAVVGDEPLLNLDIFTPKRPEYL
ncbi:cupin domain-containing protein [Azospirillum sp. B21]|nr:cupin domain-containing protein [Azospirillum sp. B21]